MIVTIKKIVRWNMMDENKLVSINNIDNINTLGIEDLCDCVIGMLKSGCAVTLDIINIVELIKNRAKLLRE